MVSPFTLDVYNNFNAFGIETFKNKILFKILWKDLVEDGRRRAKWDGNGNERNFETKKENVEWRETNSQLSFYLDYSQFLKYFYTNYYKCVLILLNMDNTFYEIIETYNGCPFAYLKKEEYTKDFENFYKKDSYEIDKVESPSHLEHLVSDENGELKASFSEESLAFVFNIKYLNGKGIISPNPQKN